jgi:hypothetical protein
MKKFFFVLAIGAFAACNNSSSTETKAGDSTAKDSAMKAPDTIKHDSTTVIKDTVKKDTTKK